MGESRDFLEQRWDLGALRALLGSVCRAAVGDLGPGSVHGEGHREAVGEGEEVGGGGEDGAGPGAGPAGRAGRLGTRPLPARVCAPPPAGGARGPL